ncbi:MAG: hypothetical protein LBU95_01420 [Rikenellaceae bacterium]|jgi:WD40 repeat protein|nr:hypothetical protein [Rikenellaceae bacterium]
MKAPKQSEKIRAIAATVNGDKFSVSEWEKFVQVWDINSGFVTKFSTDMAAGIEDAISISENGKQLAVAGYDPKNSNII